MSHPLVLGLFTDAARAAEAARAIRGVGVDACNLSIVARDHDAEGAIAEESGGTPGAEIEDSRPAARLGELGGHLLAAIAIVMPGVGPIVTAGPLAADLGEAAGHMAGSIASVLSRSGLAESRAGVWQERIERGAVLIGVHVPPAQAAEMSVLLKQKGAEEVAQAIWKTNPRD